ncbi:protein toll [Caerostris darwini]|uniref:Protein toll n=1 Tax=Caerostris darwini TaxID=1538125 RepID=A0AAV4PFU1_9ARAC|nr:protein toll [Caerostris darwini]
MWNQQKSRFQLCGSTNVNSMVLGFLVILSSCCVVSETNETVSELRNVSDVKKFNETLFQGKTFYTIIYRDDSFLPRGFLRGVNVTGLIVNDTHFQGLEEEAFEGVVFLKHFFVFRSSAKNVPDMRFIRDSVISIWFRNSRLTSLEGPNLQNLRVLEMLSFYNNSIEYIAPDTFQGTEGVKVFDISHNRLTHLPPDLFKPWKKLLKVEISHNQLLHVDQLFFRTNPVVILLDHNNLTNLDSILHPGMYNVDQLDLSHNPIPRVTENSFNGKVNNTRYINLDNCLLREFNLRHYIELHKLFKLDLNYNLIDKIINIYEANYTDDYIKTFNKNKKRGIMSGSYPDITVFYSRIKLLSMTGNRIAMLRSEDFVQLVELRSLSLRNNDIGQVDGNTFPFHRNFLQLLDLSQNKIHSLQGCVRFQSALLYLNLEYNRIEGFEEDEFEGLNMLKGMMLSGNRLTTLGSSLQKLFKLEILRVDSNRIRTLGKEQIPANLQELYLAGNPFRCDCQMLLFLNYLNSTDNPVVDVPVCTPPNDTSLIPPPSNCPPGCRCFCTHDAQRHFMSVDCSSLGLTRRPALFNAATEKNSLMLSSPIKYKIVFKNKNSL